MLRVFLQRLVHRRSRNAVHWLEVVTVPHRAAAELALRCGAIRCGKRHESVECAENCGSVGL